MLEVMSIGGEEMNEIAPEPALRENLRPDPKFARVGLGSNLDQAPSRYPVIDDLRLSLKKCVPFGMSDDRRETGHLDFVKDAV